MSTPSARKPLSTPMNTPSPRRNPVENSPSRPPVASSVPTSTGQGLARTPSLRQTRPLRKATNRLSSSFGTPDNEIENEETKSANAQLIADLKEQVHRAEQASEQYKKQLEGMQQRLDEAATEQTASEERDYQRQTELDRLKAEIKDLTRQCRELELIYNEDKQAFLQDRERQASKEADLQAVIGRLNEALRNRSAERLNTSRSTGIAETQLSDGSADGSAAARDSHAPDFLQTLQQKEAAIEALRFDLAEAQLKLAEQEHMGDGRLQALEKAIMEIKMQNARLVEENESFQMLLSEKTLKGDFMHDHHTHEDIGEMSTLAEELESTEEDTEGQSEAYKKLEADNKSLREENKALTLYIDKIIGRLLQHEGFERIIHDKEEPPPPPTRSAATDKALPAVPDQHTSTPTQTAATTAAGVATGLLQRARSVVSRPGPKARPMSYAQPAPAAPTPNENPETAPSIPLNRGHRRARSDQVQTDMAAAAVVQQMNRGSPMRTVSGGPMSPGIRPLSPQLSQGRGSYFSPTSATRAPSGSGTRGGSSANSMTSEHSEEQKSYTDGSSTAAQTGGSNPSQGQSNIPGAVMKQNQLRPLRLVQEQAVADEEQKRNNRSSWIGWLRGSTIEAQNE
ncbi:uncharacterized protein Z518_03871 [Rhinocladiella mackenziei CBS 650.93]|uniref:M protein, serotype 2.1 n=1 Tax=Rhinocladiella mackenziei CBS 650.93 TaxID=1442369 RepID=A0A0D2H675_9EURO|nr:uncharacterized protein Z518_03871 [Rhinocladiella mackenziei CBS 650.93]KIX05898.1 hypothetical protein Z518_03871 [Rhinocladiella mackenziei CBS 650.93]